MASFAGCDMEGCEEQVETLNSSLPNGWVYVSEMSSGVRYFCSWACVETFAILKQEEGE